MVLADGAVLHHLHAIAAFNNIGMEIFTWQWWVKCIVIGLIAGPLATWIVG